MLAEHEIDNLLVGQKDAIRGLIDNGKFEGAIGALSVVADMWIAEDYAYKGIELCERACGLLDNRMTEIYYTHRMVEKRAICDLQGRFDQLARNFKWARTQGAI